MEDKKQKYAYEKQNFYEMATDAEIKDCFEFAEDYKKFINNSKTERDCTKYVMTQALNNGFTKYELGDPLKAGDKKFYVNRGKGVVLFRIGENDLNENGINIIASHLDSPRLDLKQLPLCEKDGICYLKTQYYGGIKKYQWTTIPLALHGVIFTKNGEKVEFNLGEDENDPVFYISDLLPHLSQNQMKKTANEFIEGEQLDIIVGTMSDKEAQKDKVKSYILNLLNQKYGLCEEDFMCAELNAVPAYKAKDIGFDRAGLAAYGHDDKICAYTAMKAIFDVDSKNTSMCMLVDKEEIGSEGVTGIKSKIFEDLIEEICLALNKNIRLVRKNSTCYSADVTAAYDPIFSSAFDKSNAAIFNAGVCLNKYTGGRGKSDSSDASAELMQKVRKILNDNNVCWQASELGKIDLGGGGTIAMYVAALNIDTVDIGVPVLSMHAPFELISKGDLYSAYLGYKALLK